MRLTTQRRRSTPWIDTVLLLTALGACAATAIALAARSHWIAELFTHFRVQYIAAQIAVMLVLVARKRPAIAALIVPFLAVNLMAVAAYWPRNAAATRAPDDVVLMTANVNSSNVDTQRFIDLVRAEQPDAIVVLEVTDTWSAALAELTREYPAQYFAPREDPFGIGILSRTPFAAIESIDLRGAPAVDAQLALRDGRPLRLVGVHLWPPVSRPWALERNAQLAELGARLGRASGPTVVTGDFNITPYSPFLADWLETTGLADARRGRGLVITWPAQAPVLGIPIDHSFVSEHVVASELRRTGAFGSDHFAILTSLRSREE